MRRRPLIAASVVSASMLLGFFELAEDFAGSAGVRAFDSALTGSIQGWRTPWLTGVMNGITAAGSTPAVFLAAVILMVRLLQAGRRGDAFFSAGLVALGGVLSAAAKGSFARARPPVADALIPLPLSFSFPSGHTMGSLCLAYVAVYLALRADWPRRGKLMVTAIAVLYTALVGISRVYLGVHWPSDVIAAWLLGGALAVAATGVWESVRSQR